VVVEYRLFFKQKSEVIQVAKDTSFVSIDAVRFANNLIKQNHITKVAALFATDERFEYPKGTMASYFGKLGSIGKKRLRERYLSEIRSVIDREVFFRNAKKEEEEVKRIEESNYLGEH
jgi:hypothetical protein